MGSPEYMIRADGGELGGVGTSGTDIALGAP